MLFDSTVFLFVFLPVSIILYYLTPAKFKNLMLVFLSAFFYAWGEPVHLLLLIFAVIWNFVGGKYVAKGRRRRKGKAAAGIIIGADILLLTVFKYAGSVLQIAGNPLSENRFFMIPVGISFFMLQNIGYIVDVYRGDIRTQKSMLNYAVFIMMFPKIIAGPLVSCGDFEEQIVKRKLTWNKFSEGILRFIRGLAKTVILGNAFMDMFKTFYAFPKNQISALSAWMGCMAFAFGIFFSFAGYCDMAGGLGKIFGFEFPENVNYPCLATGMMDYWSRWMSTLWKWFCSYVYWPLCGENPGGIRGFFALLSAWVLIGLWHGMDITFVIWGIYFAVLIYLEGFMLGQAREKIPIVIRWIFTVIFLMVSWVFFFSPSLGKVFSWLKLMLGIGGHGFIDARAVSMITTHGILWILGILFSVPLTGKLYEKVVSGEGKWKIILNCIVYIVLFFLCIARITGGSTEAFFYYRF
ncbi:MAG: MBOAT family O-acyltransferase [Lachnospiraceae bacterium]